MEGLKCVFVVASVFVSLGAADHVPALLWGSSKAASGGGQHSALEHVTPQQFYHRVKKMTSHEPKSLVIAFFEQNLSLEDLSWRDSQDKIVLPQLRSVSSSAQFTNFFTSVRSPLKGLKHLEKDGYNMHHFNLKNHNFDIAQILSHDKKILVILELDDAKTDEDRPDLLRRHDGIISETYSRFVAEGYQVTSIYTGYHSSWVEPEVPSRKHRARRLLQDNNGTLSGSLWKSNDSTVLLYSKSVPYFEHSGIRVNLSGTPDVVSIVNDSKQTVQISFAENVNLSLEFPLSDGYWSISPIILQTDSENYSLKAYPDIEVPLSFSYHCSQSVAFTDSTGNASLVFESFQVQPYLEEASFGDTYDCVWFFTSVVWSVLFVTLLLGSILVWGLGMLMSIKTMDQFDDPKGKTIQVTSTE